MKVGFFAPHVGPASSPAAIDRACELVEDLGADSIWAVDHIAFPYGYKATYPYALHQFGVSADEPPEWWDCLTVLTYLAARTSRVAIATGVVVLPYRNPVNTAKAIATVDQLSGGRVLFGVGVGWLEDEFEALQLHPFADRGKVSDEQIEIFLALWGAADRPSYSGEHYAFPPLDVTPRPVQRPHPPILVGGNSPPALRRTVKYGQGWHALMLTPDEMIEHIGRLRAYADAAGRVEPIAISTLQPVRLTRDADLWGKQTHQERQQTMLGTTEQLVEQLLAYRDAGVEHLHTSVTADATMDVADGVEGMEHFLREVWPAYRAAESASA